MEFWPAGESSIERSWELLRNIPHGGRRPFLLDANFRAAGSRPAYPLGVLFFDLLLSTIKFLSQSCLYIGRVAFTLCNSADICTINPEPTCNATVYAAKRLDIVLQFMNFNGLTVSCHFINQTQDWTWMSLCRLVSDFRGSSRAVSPSLKSRRVDFRSNPRQRLLSSDTCHQAGQHITGATLWKLCPSA